MDKFKPLADAVSGLEKAEIPEELTRNIQTLLHYVKQRIAVVKNSEGASGEITRLFDNIRNSVFVTLEHLCIYTMDELCNMTKRQFYARFQLAKLRGGKKRKKNDINEIIRILNLHNIPHLFGKSIK